MKDVVFIAGGGTGGHVFPGVAVADARQALGVTPVFVGSPRGLENKVVPARGYALELLQVAPMTGGGVKRFVQGAWTAARAMGAAFPLVRAYRPRAVRWAGGDAAGRVSAAAAALRVPLALMEPNGVMGFTNRLLSPFAKRVYVAWESMVPAFRPGVGVHAGVPLRPGFGPRPYAPKSPLRVLVLGGSQGAQRLNQTLPEVLSRAAGGRTITVTHQTGAGREAPVRAAYASLGFEVARVVPFLDDVPDELAKADLVIARAGASSLAEICAVGRASLLIPFPYAAADHQAQNALALERSGACVCVREADLERRLLPELGRLLRDDEARSAMARAAMAAGRPTAAEDVARDLMRMAGIRPREASSSNGAHSGSSNGSTVEAP